MSGDYLWDRSGEDPEVEALEKLLGKAAWKEKPLVLASPSPAQAHPSARPSSARPLPGTPWKLFAAAALVAASLLVVVSLFFLKETGERPLLVGPAYDVAGKPLRRGGALETTETVTIHLGSTIGTVVAEPRTRLEVVAIGSELHKLRLERGTIHASIGAKVRPGLFQVETPATTCVDLGCHYTLSVDEQGRAVVHVQTGKVAFVDANGGEVYVPAHASCRATKTHGSGTPFWDDSSPELRAAIAAFDDARRDRVEKAKAVARLAPWPRDSLVLWHFLKDKEDGVVLAAFDVLSTHGLVPPGMTRERALRRVSEDLETWKTLLREYWR